MRTEEEIEDLVSRQLSRICYHEYSHKFALQSFENGFGQVEINHRPEVNPEERPAYTGQMVVYSFPTTDNKNWRKYVALAGIIGEEIAEDLEGFSAFDFIEELQDMIEDGAVSATDFQDFGKLVTLGDIEEVQRILENNWTAIEKEVQYEIKNQNYVEEEAA